MKRRNERTRMVDVVVTVVVISIMNIDEDEGKK